MRRINNTLALYCLVALSIAVYLVLGARGLGPLDDHYMFKTLFQGLPFHAYIHPESGRFFPMTAQEFVVASKLFQPSATLFYVINAVKIVFCGVVLYSCLALGGARPVTIAILWSVVVFSVGIANTVYRLSAGELSQLCAALTIAWCAQYIDQSDASNGRGRMRVTTIALVAFIAALFLKELTFVFGVVLGAGEWWRRRRGARTRLPGLFIGLISAGIGYVIFYGIWRYATYANSYAGLHAISRLEAVSLFLNSDPFMLLVVVPMTIYRSAVILRQPSRHTLGDSFLLATTAYVACYFILDLYSRYYLLPAYAFAVVGLAPAIGEIGRRWVRGAVLAAILLTVANTLPSYVADLRVQQAIVNNHFEFVTELAAWMKEHPPTRPDGRRNLVLQGVSPGADIEIIESLRSFLETFGVPLSSFQVVGSEKTNNAELSAFFNVEQVGGFKALGGDLLIFNPYYSGVPMAVPKGPSDLLITSSTTRLGPPRWTALQWIDFCLLAYSRCGKTYEGAQPDVGYSAYLHKRQAVPVVPAPLASPSYRLGPLAMPPILQTGQVETVRATVENTGTDSWPAIGRLTDGMYVNLAYRWFDGEGQVVVSGDRSAFPEPILPGDIVSVPLRITAPTIPGRFRLVVGPVQEGLIWFEGDAGRWIDITDGKKEAAR